MGGWSEWSLPGAIFRFDSNAFGEKDRVVEQIKNCLEPCMSANKNVRHFLNWQS